MNEPVSSIMSENVMTLGPTDTVDKVRQMFKENKIHHVPIVDSDNVLVGLMTTSDLLWLNRPFEDYSSIKVEEVMTTKLARLEANAKIGTAAEIFLKNWFHALPIVDEDGKLKGIVTTFDILKYEFVKEYPGEELWL